MAESKLSWSELRRALMVRAGVSEKDATAFLNAFQSQLVEALKKDKQVKVNGLGTFKLQGVAPRKSVNVTTGEEITIEGYNKIAFVPEAGVKELVEKSQPSVVSNQPSDVSQQTKEIDPIRKLGEQAEEIVDILGELGQRPGDVQRDDVQSTKEPSDVQPAKEPVDVQRDDVQSTKEPSDVQPAKEPEPVVEPIKEPETVVEPVVEPVKPVKPVEPVQPKKKEKKYHFLRDIIICVAVLLVLLIAGFFILRNQLSNWIDGMINGPEPVEVIENVQRDDVQRDDVQRDDVQSTKEGVKETVLGWYEGAKEWIMGYFVFGEVEVVEEGEEKPSDDIPSKEVPSEEVPSLTEREPIQYTDFLLTEELTEGSRLAWVAKKYYGDIVYWPYLYDANRDQISNPSDLPVGTRIRVPKLTAAQRDTTSVAFQQLREEAYNAAH